MPLFDPRTVAQIPLALLVLVWAAVVIEYWARWQHRAEQPLPLLRHPVALLALAARRLWRNRSLLWWVLGLSLATWAINSFLWRPLMLRSYLYRMHMGVAWWGFDAVGFQQFLSRLMSQAPYRVFSSMPGWDSGFPLGWGIPALILGVALLYVSLRRPAWVAPGLRRHAALLGFLSLGGPVVYLVMMVVGPRAPMDRALLMQAVGLLGGFLTEVGLIAWTVLGWSLVWQVARGGRWNLRQGLRITLRRAWVALPLVAAMALLRTVGFGIIRAPSLHWLESLWLAPEPLLFLVPWMVVGEQENLAGIWREAVELWRYRYADLGLFLLRLGALFLPVQLLSDLLNQTSRDSTGAVVIFPAVVWMLALAALTLLMALTPALFYEGGSR
jgi:hypothetical protein